MTPQLHSTQDEAPAPVAAQQSLNDHSAARGQEIRDRYGPRLGWIELLNLLADRRCVRYPCEVAFDAGPLEPGEMAHPVPKGTEPEAGYVLHVHPYFASQLQRVPYLVLYQLVLVNYGEFATADDAEAFGAAALGLTRDEYYQALCQIADEFQIAVQRATTDRTDGHG